MATTFFYISKIFWFFADPFHLFFLLVSLALIALLFNWQRFAKLILTFTAIAGISLMVFPIGDLILTPLEGRFSRPSALPENVDGIIILGGSINQEASAAWNTLESNDASERITGAITLTKRYPNSKIIFSGGSGLIQKTKLTEAEIAEQMLIALGVEKERIILEDKSRNTYQNAALTKKLINNRITGNWILVTSAYHMPRSIGAFRNVGWKTIPYPVDYKSLPAGHRRFRLNLQKNLANFKCAVHEWIGLAVYYYTGKSSDLFPR